MNLTTFLWRYLRRYAGWATISVLAVIAFGLSSATFLALVQPIFDEVLLAGDAAGAHRPRGPGHGPQVGAAQGVFPLWQSLGRGRGGGWCGYAERVAGAEPAATAGSLST